MMSQPGVREASDVQRPVPSINISGFERKASLLAGSGLLLFGVKRGSLGGLGLATLGGLMAYRGVSGHCSVYQAIGRSTADRNRGLPAEDYEARGIHLETAITIMRSPEDLYNFWRDFRNLPRIMDHLQQVEVIDEKRSRWVAKVPAGIPARWEAEIINEEPNRLIAWRSVGGTDVHNAGSVRFIPAPGNRGTEVRVTMDYVPPAGRIVAALAKFFGSDPRSVIREDLRNFKRIMETGERPTTQGQPRGNCSGGGRQQKD
jgi:uncharacterized membrane protein